jgi:hypothetical protein
MLLESTFQIFLSHPKTFETLQQTSKDDEESVGWDLKIVGQKGLGIVSKTVFTYSLLLYVSRLIDRNVHFSSFSLKFLTRTLVSLGCRA